jgi:hypothetical protein
MKMRPHYLFKGSCELIAGISPFTDQPQLQDRRASEFRRIEVLMRDRVSPGVQLLKPLLTCLIANVHFLYFAPERKPESIVVFPNVTGIGITCLELPVLKQDVPECRPQKTGRNLLHEVVRTFQVQIPTLSLKLGEQQDGVCLIDLLGGIAPPAARTADAPVGSLHLIESGPPHGPPGL